LIIIITLNRLQLVKDFRANDQTAVDLLNTYAFHVMPIANPDGYDYTFTGVTTILFKSRQFLFLLIFVAGLDASMAKEQIPQLQYRLKLYRNRCQP